jgi:hypothetical protein
LGDCARGGEELKVRMFAFERLFISRATARRVHSVNTLRRGDSHCGQSLIDLAQARPIRDSHSAIIELCNDTRR